MFCFFVGAVVGMLEYKNNWFPLSIYRTVVIAGEEQGKPPKTEEDQFVAIYSAGGPLYSNRLYYDQIGDKRLDLLYIVRIRRHEDQPIQLDLRHRTKVYRFLNDTNNNSIYADWEQADLKVRVQGDISLHSKVITKVFEAGSISLPPGGPATADPILLEDLEDNRRTPFILKREGDL
ncbi:MAG: hypothetical protein HRT71_15820 [Flavobacteriales bacterium]|nr:hypothetical protein [Flavobacteriales bacterium]